MRAMHNTYYERDKINFEGSNMQVHSSIDLIKIVITLVMHITNYIINPLSLDNVCYAQYIL